MPTRPDADLVPVKKATKARLAAIKGEGSYDDAVRALLAAADRPVIPSKERDPEEQVALAELAARRWGDAVQRGRIVERGERLLVWKIEEPVREGLRASWSGRRGFDP